MGGDGDAKLGAQPFDGPEAGHRFFDVGQARLRDAGEKAARLLDAETHVGVYRHLDVGADCLAHRPHHADLACRRVESDLELEHGSARLLHRIGGDFGHDAGDLGVRMALVGIYGVGIGDEGRAFAYRPAQEPVEGHPRLLAGDVPECLFDGGEGVALGRIFGIAVIEGRLGEAGVANRAAVVGGQADDGVGEAFVDDACPPVAPRLPQPQDAGLGLDLDDGAFDVGELHFGEGGDARHRNVDGRRPNGFDLHV